jgi:hypothetical protein
MIEMDQTNLAQQIEMNFHWYFGQATLGSGGVDCSPPGLSSPPPPHMEDIEPPAGLQFSMLQPTLDENLGEATVCGVRIFCM